MKNRYGHYFAIFALIFMLGACGGDSSDTEVQDAGQDMVSEDDSAQDASEEDSGLDASEDFSNRYA